MFNSNEKLLALGMTMIVRPQHERVALYNAMLEDHLPVVFNRSQQKIIDQLIGLVGSPVITDNFANHDERRGVIQSISDPIILALVQNNLLRPRILRALILVDFFSEEPSLAGIKKEIRDHYARYFDPQGSFYYETLCLDEKIKVATQARRLVEIFLIILYGRKVR